MTPKLENITIASLCQADWETMQGTEQVRFCQQCQLNVYNLSGMSRNEAETLIQSKEGRLCVRFYQRPDGTVLTQDCPVGLQALHRRKLSKLKQWGSFAAAVSIITVVGAFSVSSYAAQPTPTRLGEATMGDMSIHTAGTVAPTAMQGNIMITPVQGRRPIKPKKPCKLPKQQPATTNTPKTTPEPHPVIMGKMAAPRDYLPTPSNPPETKQNLPPETPQKH